MIIRKASFPKDLESIRQLLKSIELTITPEPADIETPIDQWFVCQHNKEIVGIVAARRNGEIRHLAVSGGCRRMGVGRKMVKQAVKFLREHKGIRIWAQVRLDNVPSQRLFENLGFTRELRPVTSRKNPDVRLFRYSLLLHKAED